MNSLGTFDHHHHNDNDQSMVGNGRMRYGLVRPTFERWRDFGTIHTGATIAIAIFINTCIFITIAIFIFTMFILITIINIRVVFDKCSVGRYNLHFREAAIKPPFLLCSQFSVN